MHNGVSSGVNGIHTTVSYSKTKGQHPLVTLKVFTDNEAIKELLALIDCGASNNFVGRKSLEGIGFPIPSQEKPSELEIRLATGDRVSVPKCKVNIPLRCSMFSTTVESYVIRLNNA